MVEWASGEKRSAPCKLNNANKKRTRIYRYARTDGSHKNSFESLDKVINENGFSCSDAVKIQFIESLILAQDERWRRA